MGVEGATVRGAGDIHSLTCMGSSCQPRARANEPHWPSASESLGRGRGVRPRHETGHANLADAVEALQLTTLTRRLPQASSSNCAVTSWPLNGHLNEYVECLVGGATMTSSMMLSATMRNSMSMCLTSVCTNPAWRVPEVAQQYESAASVVSARAPCALHRVYQRR